MVCEGAPYNVDPDEPVPCTGVLVDSNEPSPWTYQYSIPLLHPFPLWFILPAVLFSIASPFNSYPLQFAQFSRDPQTGQYLHVNLPALML